MRSLATVAGFLCLLLCIINIVIVCSSGVLDYSPQGVWGALPAFPVFTTFAHATLQQQQLQQQQIQQQQLRAQRLTTLSSLTPASPAPFNGAANALSSSSDEALRLRQSELRSRSSRSNSAEFSRVGRTSRTNSLASNLLQVNMEHEGMHSTLQVPPPPLLPLTPAPAPAPVPALGIPPLAPLPIIPLSAPSTKLHQQH